MLKNYLCAHCGNKKKCNFAADIDKIALNGI